MEALPWAEGVVSGWWRSQRQPHQPNGFTREMDKTELIDGPRVPRAWPRTDDPVMESRIERGTP